MFLEVIKQKSTKEEWLFAQIVVQITYLLKYIIDCLLGKKLEMKKILVLCVKIAAQLT